MMSSESKRASYLGGGSIKSKTGRKIDGKIIQIGCGCTVGQGVHSRSQYIVGFQRETVLSINIHIEYNFSKIAL